MASRTDLLPLATIRKFGLPFHGLVTGRNLRLPDNTTKRYPYLAHTSNGGSSLVWAGGEAIPVAGPGASVPAPTAHEAIVDADNNYNWKAYAFLSGIERNIGGKSLGQHSWLYCDGRSTWKLRAEIYRPAYNDITIRIYLSSLFGLISDQQTQVASETLIASLPFVPKLCTWRGISLESAAAGTCEYYVDYAVISQTFGTYAAADLFVYPKSDGSEALISFGFERKDYTYINHYPKLGNQAANYAYSLNSWSYPEGIESAITTRPYDTQLRGVFKVIVSGVGSLADGQVGDGISATLTLYKDMEDLHVVTWTGITNITDPCWFTPGSSGVRAGFDVPAVCDVITQTTTTEVQTFLYSYDSDDNEVCATVTHVLTWTQTDEGSVIPTTGEYSYVITYGGKTLSWSYTVTGTSVYVGTPVLQFVPSEYQMPGAANSTSAPYLFWDSALGDRTLLFAEWCWGNDPADGSRVTDSYYISADGSQYDYHTTASTIGSSVVVPSIVIKHGFVTHNKPETAFSYAGLLPAQVCYV